MNKNEIEYVHTSKFIPMKNHTHGLLVTLASTFQKQDLETKQKMGKIKWWI